MYPRMVAIKAQVQMEGTETEKRLANMLFEDQVHVLSTFELNQIASLTYGDESCDQIFEMLQACMAQPLEYPVLAVQKALVITKHVLVYGSEKCVNSAWGLGSYVDALKQFNTVLWAQEKNGGSVGSWWMQLKGGAVDKGFPVREAAENLDQLLSKSEAELQNIRHDKADPNSLVPIGDDRVGFISDKVRHFMLTKRMEEHQLIRTKSNLAKSQGGFGSGFTTKDGKTVVGAAHSLDEMMARAQREKKKYSDSGPIHYRPRKQTSAPKPKRTSKKTSQPQSLGMDLLGFDDVPSQQQPKADVDLLDFGASPAPAPAPAPTAPVLDIFSTPAPSLITTPAPQVDLLGSFSAQPAPSPSVQGTTDLLSLMTVSAPAPSADTLAPTSNGLLDMTPTEALEPTKQQPPSLLLQDPPPLPPQEPPKKSIMGSNADRFAALDDLIPPSVGAKAGSVLSGLEAQNRILGFGEKKSTTRSASAVFGGLSTEPTLGASTMDTPPATSTSLSMGALPLNDEPVADAAAPSSIMGGEIHNGFEPVALPPVMGGETSFDGASLMGGGDPMGGVMGGAAADEVMGGQSSGYTTSAPVMGGSAMVPPTELPPIPPSDPPPMPPSGPPPLPPSDLPPMPPSGPPPMPPSGLPLMPPSDPPPMAMPGSRLPNTERYGADDPHHHHQDDDNGFLMGGSMGAGLGDPIADAPAAPPPPPPPY